MIMVSACLMGEKCKYDGGSNYHPEVAAFLRDKPHIKVCPEVMGGLPTPRPASEIESGQGDLVLDNMKRVLTCDGLDVTPCFKRGADICLKLARENGVDMAILKARSPSCGCGNVYDGSFASRLVEGMGVTAALLRRNGIKILNEEDFGRREE